MYTFTPEQLQKYERIAWIRGFIWGAAAVGGIIFAGLLVLDLYIRGLA